MENKLKIWKIVFLLFLMAGTIYIIRNNQSNLAQEKAAKNWQKIDEKGNKYSSESIDENYIRSKGNVFGTYYSITYRAPKDLHEAIRERLAAVDNSLSPFNKGSLITAINENRDTVADAMFTAVFNLAQNISEKTSGAFDITVAPLVNAWGFGFKNGIAVDSLTIDSMMQYVGYRSIALNDGKVTKQQPETMLNCSAIAKGYGCDAVARTLQSKGIEDYMIEIGGEVVLKGKNKKSTPWVIGINKPSEDGSNELQTVLQLTDCSMATSGTYRNFRFIDGKKVSHTIDPLTGYPANHSLLSATVIADECAYADALATAFMVMGKDRAMEYCTANPEIEAYFIYADDNGSMKTVSTKGFNRYIRK